MAIKSWARGANAPGTGFTISPKTFEDLSSWIEDNEASVHKAQQGKDALVQLMAYYARSEAMSKSMGQAAPRQRSNPALAYRIPVQRITGRYYASWYVRKLGNAMWAFGNDSPEAYLIETGMFQRVRRPIMKMSVISLLRYLQATKAIEGFADWVIAPRRNSRGQFSGFAQRMGQSGFVSTMAGPSGKLPG